MGGIFFWAIRYWAGDLDQNSAHGGLQNECVTTGDYLVEPAILKNNLIT
jgi:hypothetical protein